MRKLMIVALVAAMTTPAIANCGHYCQYRVFNRTAEPLQVIVAFPDGHRCDEVVKPGHNMFCTRHSYVPKGERYAVMYSPNHILAGKSDSHRGVTLSCQWVPSGRFQDTDWKIITPKPGACQIVNSYW